MGLCQLNACIGHDETDPPCFDCAGEFASRLKEKTPMPRYKADMRIKVVRQIKKARLREHDEASNLDHFRRLCTSLDGKISLRRMIRNINPFAVPATLQISNVIGLPIRYCHWRTPSGSSRLSNNSARSRPQMLCKSAYLYSNLVVLDNGLVDWLSVPTRTGQDIG